MVIFKLIIASVVIGLVLSFFGFNPHNLYDALTRLVHWISSLSMDALENVMRYLILGAIVVVPLWLIACAQRVGRQRRQTQDLEEPHWLSPVCEPLYF